MTSTLVAEYTSSVQVNDKWDVRGERYIAFLGKGVLFIIRNNHTFLHTFVLSGVDVTLRSGCITVHPGGIEYVSMGTAVYGNHLVSDLESDPRKWQCAGAGSSIGGIDLAFEKDSDLETWFEKLRGLTKRNYTDVVEEIGKRGKLGHGMFAGVTRGRIRGTGQEVAIKRFNKFWSVSEIFVCVALEHPNIVPAVDVLLDGRQLCIAMPVVNGGKLRDYLKRTQVGRLEEGEAQKVTRQILQAVLYMHKLGIAHNDLHTGNILCHLHDDGSIKPMIIDFGMCSINGGGDTENDVRLIGQAVYVMVTGKTFPYFTDNAKLISNEISVHASNEACEFVLDCLGIRGTPMTSEEALKNVWLAQRQPVGLT